MSLKQIQAMIFDLDGTLFQTEELGSLAFQRTFDKLHAQGIWQNRPTREQIHAVYGMTTAELWAALLPQATEEERSWADKVFLEEELNLLHAGVGKLFPGVAETLAYFRERGIRLYIASNGGERYVKGVVRAMHIEHLFTGVYSAGEYKTSRKEQLVGKILLAEQSRHTLMVGDRRSDVQAGKAHGLFVVGCSFGFAGAHELDEADRIIQRFEELRDLVGV